MQFKNVSKNALKQWLVYGLIGLFISLIITFIAFMAIHLEAGDNRLLLHLLITLPLFLITLLIITEIVVIRKIRFKNLTYKLDTNRIERTSGVIFLSHQVVPFIRMQHVEIFRTMTDRIFGMSTLIVHTAGSTIRIPCLDVSVADELLNEIRDSLDKLKEGDSSDK